MRRGAQGAAWQAARATHAGATHGAAVAPVFATPAHRELGGYFQMGGLRRGVGGGGGGARLGIGLGCGGRVLLQGVAAGMWRRVNKVPIIPIPWGAAAAAAGGAAEEACCGTGAAAPTGAAVRAALVFWKRELAAGGGGGARAAGAAPPFFLPKPLPRAAVV